jgi:H+/Cl- antiporter ClcA
MQIQQRSIALYVVLSIVTCGIFALYWYYTIATDIYNSNNTLGTTPIVTLLLNIITGSIYGMYAYYKWGSALNAVCVEKGIPGEDRSVLYLILSIFGLGIINMALIQSDLNQMATAE